MTLMNKIAKSSLVRKGGAALNRVPRMIRRLQSSDADYRAQPPIIVNSLPKSGTHLMMQLAADLPDAINYGTFLAQTPSYSQTPRTQAQIDARIAVLAPGEIVGAHLHYTPQTAAALAARHAFHLFIWRDPRDVILSESHYLAEMARFHAMHPTFKKIADRNERVRLAITGDGTAGYGDARERVMAYMGWRDDADTTVFRYEDLSVSETQNAEIDRLVSDFARKTGKQFDQDALVARLTDAIDPARSHTFHKGGVARWKTEMSPDNQTIMKHLFDGTDLLTDVQETQVPCPHLENP